MQEKSLNSQVNLGKIGVGERAFWALAASLTLSDNQGRVGLQKLSRLSRYSLIGSAVDYWVENESSAMYEVKVNID